MDMKQIGVYAIVALLAIGLVFALVANSNKLSEEDVNSAIANAVSPLQNNVAALTKDISDADTANKALVAELDVLKADIEVKDTKITELEAELEAQAVEAAPEVIIADPFYLIEDVGLTGNFGGEVIDNDNLKKLIYSEVEYDGEDYDVEEFLLFGTSFKPALNVEDFGSDIAIEIDSEGLSYKLVFDEPILLVEDEDLIVNFLGRELAIVNSDNDKITYRTSQKASLRLGEEFTYQNNIIKVVGFDDGDVNSVLLSVDGDLVSLEEDDNDRINGVEIAVKDIFLSTIGDYNSAVLYVGEDIMETVNDREEFDYDDRFDWIIESDSFGISAIGLMLIEEYTEEDEVLALGDSLSLPYDYITVTFDSLRELEVTDIKASVRTDEIKIEFDGIIEIDGKKIDDGMFIFDGTTVEYEYRGDDMTTTDLSDIVIFVDDRELSFAYDSVDDFFSIGDYDFGYDFVTKDIFSAPSGMNEDEDFRMDNGDILYKSDANDSDEEETSIMIGLVNDEAKEVIVKVV